MSTASQVITNLGINFNAREVAPQQAMEAVPLGWYSVKIVPGSGQAISEIKPTEGGNGRRMVLVFEITEGQYKGRKIIDGFNYIHSNPQTSQIAAGQVSAICHAVGVFDLTDITQLFERPFQIKAGIEPAKWVDADGFECEPNTPNSKQYEARNKFAGAKAGSAPLPAAGAGGPLPAWSVGGAPAAAPAAAPAPAPSAAPVTAGAPAMPWGGQAAAPAPAPAPVATPAAAAPAAPVKGKPGRKPKAAAPAAPAAAPAPVAAPERKFYVGLEGDQWANPLPESQIIAFLKQGMPANTPLCLEGESDYKDAAAYNVGAAPAPAAPAVAVPPPAPVPAAPVPAPAPAPAMPWQTPPAAAPAAPAGAPVPPWGK